jgi:hypothetical protein
MMRVGPAVLLLAALACANPLGAGDLVPSGPWGGAHVALEVTADGGRIEYDCAHGALDQPLVLDEHDRFDVIGSHTLEHGGPIRDGEPLLSRPARYIGRIDDGRMTLTVTLTDTGESIGSFTLTQGETGRVLKCL